MCWRVHIRFRNAIDAVYWQWTRKHVALNTPTSAPRPEQTAWYSTEKNTARETSYICTATEIRTGRHSRWLHGLTCGTAKCHTLCVQKLSDCVTSTSPFFPAVSCIQRGNCLGIFVLPHIVTLRKLTDRVGESASFWEIWGFNPEIGLLTYLITYLHTNLLTYLHTYLLTYLITYVHT